MAKYKVSLQYAGTRYAGWQIQKNLTTIQGLLKQAVETVSGERTNVVGAGRTDAGVHALEQVAHFRLEKRILPKHLARALNGVLPWDIRVLKLSEVAEQFHAQRDALRKRYEYRIYNGPVLSPFRYGFVYHCLRKLDVAAMQHACRFFEGVHDFSAFTASSSKVENKKRKIFLSRIKKKGHAVSYLVEAQGFLHHMVRNMVGTLLEVGRGRLSADDIHAIFRSHDRRLAGPTAPPQGLYLVKIWY
ncbi:MAG: tRNA pseudouridine(38-40) synthase TruA [Acidobacteria bacterium]|nr:tRNA pseudouridine(38-40) synthase TruA [Acidobacteriota bacterium]